MAGDLNNSRTDGVTVAATRSGIGALERSRTDTSSLKSGAIFEDRVCLFWGDQRSTTRVVSIDFFRRHLAVLSFQSYTGNCPQCRMVDTDVKTET